MSKVKYYQYLQGEKQGEITTLQGVENEDGTTYLVFADGNRCNVEFVSVLNDTRAYTSGKFMSEVYDTKNVWTFEKKNIQPDVRYGTLKDTGEVVQGWDPYIHGRHGNENKARSSVTAIPPKHVVTKSEMTSGAEKLKSLGIDPNTPGYEEGLKSLTIPTQDSLQSKIMGNGLVADKKGAYSYEHVESEGTTMHLDSAAVRPPSEKDMEQFKRGTEIYIPEDLKNEIDNEIVPVEEEQPHVSVSVSQNVTEKVEKIFEEKIKQTEPESKINISSPIYSIVSKCKKKEVSIPLNMEIKIPSKSIYNLINEEYDEESVKEFFDIILDEISTDDIKECLKNALIQSYTA